MAGGIAAAKYRKFSVADDRDNSALAKVHGRKRRISSLSELPANEGDRHARFTYPDVQRARKRFVNLSKQNPGRARQKARAGRNFSQPRTCHFRDLCT